MALWMNLGTINVVNGSKAVTGVGTKFKTSPIPAREGQPIVINNVHYEIGSVNSDTSITLALNYAGATANSLPYTIVTTAEGSFNDLARRAAQVMGAYQVYMDAYNDLFTGTGNVTITLPDGSTVTLPAWSSMQKSDATLTAFAALTGAANKLPYFTGNDTFSLADLTAFGRSLIDDANAAEAYTTLGFSTLGKALVVAATAAAARSSLGFSAVGDAVAIAVNAAAARTALALGAAAVANVGENTGEVMPVGAYGLGATTREKSLSLAYLGHSGFFHTDGNTLGLNTGELSYHVIMNVLTPDSALRISCVHNTSDIGFQIYNGSWSTRFQFLHTGNSVKDSNGFWKGASPVVRVGGSEDLEEGFILCGQGAANCEALGVYVTKLGEGHYSVSGSLGLAKSGWYIETPSDANGNKLRYVEYTENEDAVIEVKTFEPDYSNGRCQPGAPKDIPAGRWIDLRLEMPYVAPPEPETPPVAMEPSE